jgi:IclR family transcriptional regulator, mhp operon transcriptional activator
VRDYQVKPVESLGRGIDVLLALQEAGPASLHELHRTTGVPKSSLLRILRTLHGRGLVHQRLADGAFLAGHTLTRRAPDDAGWLVEIAGPALRELGRRVVWPALLSMPRPDHMETVDAVNTRAAGAYFDDYPTSPVGFRSDLLRGASGRAYLAWCPDEEREAVLLRLGEHDAAARDTAAVRRLVETTRARGYSVRDAEYGGAHVGTGLAHAAGTRDDGRSSIALPILANGQVLGCVNLTWRRGAVTLDQVVERHLADLRAAVAAIRGAAAGAGEPGAVGRAAPGQPARSA